MGSTFKSAPGPCIRKTALPDRFVVWLSTSRAYICVNGGRTEALDRAKLFTGWYDAVREAQRYSSRGEPENPVIERVGLRRIKEDGTDA